MTNLGYTPEEAIAAIATPLAPGAIGIVRCSGKDCLKLFSAIFSRPKALLSASGNTLVYGWIIDKESNVKVDEVMVGVYKNPKSFTGEDMAEIFCHGGLSVVKGILSLLLRSGFRQAERGEFTFRAYINGKCDLTKAEAVKEIIDSKTDASRDKAAQRLSGSLFEEVNAIKELVKDTLASIEVGIEYPEDEETISDTFNQDKLEEAADRLQTLVNSWQSEKLYQDGCRVVLCGKTNAGKSSLFNALLKEERAIVSDQEGTTRDYLESWASFAGLPVRVFDTAGLRETEDSIEEKGIKSARDLSRQADVILYLVDSRKGLDKDDLHFLQAQKDIPLLLVWNKCDAEDAKALPLDASYKAVAVSAKRGTGLNDLALSVKDLIFQSVQVESSRANVAVGSLRQKEALQEALERIKHALEVSLLGFTLDAAVQDLEDSLDSLGQVTGAVTPDDILGSIFANFCVGK